jgi:Metalloenzyme superfamily
MLRGLRLIACLAMAAAPFCCFAAAPSNVVLVTMDGLRWQEIFRGADEKLLKDERFTAADFKAFPSYQQVGTVKSRSELLPFFWGTLAKRGSLIGDRDNGSPMNVTNPWWFSYPGYNEMLTGVADPAVDSNDKRWNSNVTVLEWLNRQRGFEKQVRAYSSWEVFSYIVNTQRSGVVVNDAFASVTDQPTQREQWLNKLQSQLAKPWPWVRHDAITHNYAMEALRSRKTRVLYIGYGEADDFGHEGKYGQYLEAIRRFDGFLQEIWDTLQADTFYRDRTVLLVTTDHGRGETPLENWVDHSSRRATHANEQQKAKYPDGIVGSDQVWFAAIGPGITARGSIAAAGPYRQSQVAATLLKSIGLRAADFSARADEPIDAIFESGSR